MIADTLQKRALLTPSQSQLDQRLQQLTEQRIAPQAAGLQVIIHRCHVASAPEVHQAVHLVNEGRGDGRRSLRSPGSCPCASTTA